MRRILIFLTLIFLVTINVHAQSLVQIKSKANEGDAYSQYLIGFNYANGLEGLSRDYAEAKMWLDKAISNGFGMAAEFLGTFYYYGIGEREDVSKALYYYRKAKELGVADVALVDSRIDDCLKRLNQPSLNNSYRASTSCSKQNENIHRAISFDPSRPPILEIVSNSFKFLDPNGNNAIDAGETCYISFKVKNKGKGVATGCIANAQSADAISGLTMSSSNLRDLNPDETEEVRIPVNANMNILDGNANIVVQVNEPHGLGTDPLQLSIATRQFIAPKLEIVDYAITSSNGSTLKRKSPFDLQMLLQNVNHGNAECVSIDFEAPSGIIVMNSDNQKQTFSNISGGATKSLIYQLIITDNFKGNSIPIDIHIKEKYGKYAQDKHIDLQLNQSMSSNKIVVDEKVLESKSFDIQVASLTSDVDKAPIVVGSKADNTFAVVIANEAYNKEASVPFAANDGKIFAEYCKNVLGLPSENVHIAVNATLNDIKHEIRWLANVLETRKGNAKAIFYYAGHGIPDEASKNAYLLPVDGYGSDVTTGYPLEQLYKDLGSVPSQEVAVFLDACFSGAKREGGMLASARGIALKANRGEPIGNMVVFSAAQGDETAYPYKKERHGLFTYYLLKELKDTKGDVTLKQLGDYVTDEVSKQSIVINSKPQTPTVIPAKIVADKWGNWNLK